jgi:hypothetical protein
MAIIALLLLFVGAILIIFGVYENKIKRIRENVKIEYRFVPRSYYDEQIFSNVFESKYANLFDKSDTWPGSSGIEQDRNSGQSNLV